MSQIIPCPECGSDDTAHFAKRNMYQCGDCCFTFDGPVASPAVIKPMRIFLSYGHDHNVEIVQRIKADLEELGHDVWFDRQEIKSGDDWRRSITDGIRDSDWMFSFLSKHSTRDPGVCLDELGIALGVKGGIVQTILVEGEADVAAPVSVSHIQWLDMHDWQTRQQDDPEGFAAWYASKYSEIRRVLQSEANQRFAGEIEKLYAELKPVTMDAFTSRLLEKGFSGREWLVADLEEWLQRERGSRALIITGEPGVGKSAFSAWLAHHNKANVLAAVFMRYNQPQSCDPGRVVCTLAFQLATRLPDYRKHLIHLAELTDLDCKNESELFTYLLAEPLKLCIDGNRKGVIIIDALDEAPVSSGVAELLARHAQELPAWLKIVATTRPEPRLLALLAELHPHRLDADDLRHRQDIADYLKKQLASFNPSAEVIDAIVAKSEGIFLYAEQVAAQVRDRGLSLDQLDRFPEGLPGIYTQYFQRQFPDVDRYHSSIAPLLQILLAAQEPLGRDELTEILGWCETATHRQLLALGSLFPEVGNKIQPYHRSLGEWLTASDKAGDYFISLRDGHRILAVAGWKKLQRLIAGKTVDPVLSPATLHAGTHLYVSGMEDELQQMVSGVVSIINCGIAGYDGLIDKLVDWVASNETFAAETLFKSVLGSATKLGCGHEIASILDHRARVLGRTGRTLCAHYLCESNVQIFQKLVAMEPENTHHQRNLSVAYIKMGDMDGRQDPQKAWQWYLKGLESSEKLVAIEPDNTEYLCDLFISCNRMGKMDGRQNPEKARNWYLKGLDISEKLVAMEPDNIQHLRSLFLSCDNMGDMDCRQDPLKARQWYLKGLEICEQLVALDPDNDEYLGDLSTSYNNIGKMDGRQNQEKARQWYLKGLDISEKLVAMEPDNTELLSSFCFSNDCIGDIDIHQDPQKAKHWYLRSLETREKMVALEPDNIDYLYNIYISYSKMGDMDERQELPNSQKWFLQSLEICEKLVALDPGNIVYLSDLSHLFNKMGEIIYRQDTQKAQKWFLRGLEIREKLVTLEPGNTGFLSALAISCDNVSHIDNAPQKARQLYLKGLEIRENLFAMEPDNIKYLHDLSFSFINLGDIDVHHDLKKARQWYLKALEIREKLVALEPVNTQYLSELSFSSEKIGDMYAQHDPLKSRQWYLKSLEICEKLVNLTPDNIKFWINLTSICSLIAESFLLQAMTDEEREYSMKAAEAINRADELSPDDSNILYGVACALARLKMTDKALTALKRSIEAGYINVDHAAQDFDLVSLRGLPEFESLLERMRQATVQCESSDRIDGIDSGSLQDDGGFG